MTQTVLILGGSGKIGSHCATTFARAGWTVRHYDRKTGDMTAAARGVDVIVNGLNPPNYRNWATEIPAITAQVIAAAKASGATVIVPGNVYNFGKRPGVLDADTPQKTHTRKGLIRVEMEAAYRASGVRTVILRAGNFIDPQGNGDLMSLVTLKDVAKGKVTALGDPDAMQAYAYVPDWARAAVMLAERRDSLPVFADIPFPGHAFTIRDLASQVGRMTGKPVRIARFPWWLMTLAAPVWGLREMREMRYLYDLPHEIGGATFAKALPDFQPTPLETVIRAALARNVDPDKAVRPGQQTIVTE